MTTTFIPVNSIRKSYLMDVPPSYYSERLPARSKPVASGIAKLFRSAQDEAKSNEMYRSYSEVTLNVAGWVSLPVELRRPVSLIAVYRDNAGEHGVLVEEMQARGASQVLLSGVVEIRAEGRIQSVKLFCGGLKDSRVSIQHMHLQKVSGQLEESSLSAC